MSSNRDPTLPVELTGHEVVWLVDNILVADIDQGDPDHPHKAEPIARQLLLKLGTVFLELVDERKGVSQDTRSISLTQKEAWLIKSKVRIGDRAIGDVAIGLTLLPKILHMILEFNHEHPDVMRTPADARMTELVPTNLLEKRVEEKDVPLVPTPRPLSSRERKAQRREMIRNAGNQDKTLNQPHNDAGTGKGT